jgi:rod shape-determining protein MreC
MRKFLKKNKFIVWIIILALIVVLLNVFQKEVKNFFYSFSAPAQNFFWKIGDRTLNFFSFFSNNKALNEENEKLKKENQELIYKISFIDQLKEENEKMRQALGIGMEKEFRLLMVESTGKDINADRLILNKGIKDGVNKDMVLINENKVLFGKISEVYDNFSKATLISDKNSSFEGRIQGKEVFAVVKGKGNTGISFQMVPREKEMSEGDIIISAGSGAGFPEGLLVGRIIKIEKNDVNPFQEAEIKPFFEIKESETLFLIEL